MRTKPNDLVTPVQSTEYAPGFDDALTKREYFAALVLSGMGALSLSDKEYLNADWVIPENTTKVMAERAVSYADALIVALNKGKEPVKDE